MFLGHFGVGFAAKRVAPAISLGWLFMAAQFLDLLWPTLLLLDIERVSIVPGATAVTPLVFEYYPFSHSLLAVLGWAAVVGGGYWLLRRNRLGSIVLASLVISHWMLDAVVHQPDLPLLPGNGPKVGLNGWSSLPVTLALELSLFVCGLWIYFRTTTAMDGIGRWAPVGLILLLLTIYMANLFGGPPPNVISIAWGGQLQWLLVLGGYWMDKHRSSC